MRKTVLSMILAAALGGSTLALAAGGAAMGHEGHGHHGMMAMHELDKLNLSDAQRDNVKQLTKQSFEQLKPQMQTLHQQREAFESLEPTASGYQTAAGNLANAEGTVARARVMQEASLRAQIYNVLTPTQRSQLATLRTQQLARMQQWKEFRAQHPLPGNGSSAQ